MLAPEDIQQFFLFYSLFFSLQKTQIISRFQEKCSLLLKNTENKEVFRKDLRTLKFSLIDGMCREMMAELYTYALRTQLVQATDDIVNILSQLPNSEKLLFIVGKPPKLHHTKTFPARVKNEEEEETSPTRFFTISLTFVDLKFFQICEYACLFRVAKKAGRTLQK